MRKLSLDEIRKIEVEILDEIDRYSKEHGLEYFLNGGTLIGAIRHKGFIPWDDDIDIYMPRESYELFLQNFNHDGNQNYRVTSCRHDPKYPNAYAKTYATNTKLTEKFIRDYHRGVFVDVFPLDDAGDSLDEILALNRRLNAFRTLVDWKRATAPYVNTLWKHVKFYIRKILTTCTPLVFVTNQYLNRKIDRLSQSLARPDSTYCADLAYGLSSPDTGVFLKEWFRTFVLVDFEGRQYRAPVDYHMVLTNLFGDYMTPPPLEERIPHGLEAWGLE